jgi:hypothetical protein
MVRTDVLLQIASLPAIIFFRIGFYGERDLAQDVRIWSIQQDAYALLQMNWEAT